MTDLPKRRIEAAIQKADTSPARVSVAIGLDRGFVGKLGWPRKNGKIPVPGALKLRALAQALNVPAAWFIDAISPDEAEVARGVDWPPATAADPPKPGQFIMKTLNSISCSCGPYGPL